MNDKLYIKNQRQRRALLTLLEKPTTVKELGPKIGALNPRQTIFELRNQGFRRMILTRRFTVIDQDGVMCRPGEYYIPDEFKPCIEVVLKEGGCLVTSRKSTPRRPNQSHCKEDV